VLEKKQQLYQRICAYELDDPSHEIGFLAHLMRANGWSRPLALRATEEYRKFVFLALVANHPVTPSDQVDQVWHLHLPFRSWRGWRPWRRWRWSGPMGVLLIGLGVIGSALASAAAESSNEPASGSEGLLWLLASTLLAGSVWIAFDVLRPLLRQPSEGRGMPALNVLELAYLARGPGGALQAALASLVVSGALLPNRERRSLVALGESKAPLEDLAQQMVRVHHTLRGRSNAEVSYQDIINPVHYDFTALVVRLQGRQLLLQGHREVIALAAGNPFARFFLGVAVAQFLFVLLPAAVWLFRVPPTLAISLALSVPSGRTLWAENVLEYYRIATIHGEALRRVALLGPEEMTGGRLDDLRGLIKDVEADQAGSGGCGC